MLRLLPRRGPRPRPPAWTTVLALVLLAALGGMGLGLRWTPLAPAAPSPAARPLLLLQPASAAPAPRHVTRSLSELGLAGALAPRGLSDYALLFARAPKAGTELPALLLQRLQAANGFRMLPLPLPPRLRGARLPATEQEELVARVTDALRREALPVAFHGDVFFTNFTTFDRQSPTYLGFLRDPVDRALAGFYHATESASTTPTVSRSRRGRDASGAAAPVDNNHLNRPLVDGVPEGVDVPDILERCLQATARRPECAWFEPQTPYFCGQDSRCGPARGDGGWALQRAKANMDQYFPVVGILEELNATLAVLESRLPLFFAGVRDVYRHQLHEPHVNWDRKKTSNFKPEVRKKVEKRLAFEYELYIWSKQRLMQQHFEDSLKTPTPDEAGQDRIAHSIHKRAHSVLPNEKLPA
ncbi:Uronyl 2-sulfotransferase [Frankliniella fusca]|uniref:Uronyl 2-sulfotransferase n=1 Tax=Frankliniella fusca TaxID=407009 RepID=A0AAE1L608_9NEOP|nr:Uronyl 2-sulfotransferase [Frankliniella fusca]